MGVPLLAGGVAVVVHPLALLAVIGLVAVVVYDKVGLGILRKGRVNVGMLWAGALVAAGMFTSSPDRDRRQDRAVRPVSRRRMTGGRSGAEVVAVAAGNVNPDWPHRAQHYLRGWSQIRRAHPRCAPSGHARAA